MTGRNPVKDVPRSFLSVDLRAAAACPLRTLVRDLAKQRNIGAFLTCANKLPQRTGQFAWARFGVVSILDDINFGTATLTTAVRAREFLKSQVKQFRAEVVDAKPAHA
jgi:hypothetical protein